MKHIAILLTVFNRKDKTLACLERLYATQEVEGISFDVWLTNDGCTDGTPEAVKKRFPKVNIINGNGNLYWNRGMYTAWQAAAKARDYDFYLWLNDDTYIKANALKVLMQSSARCEDKSVIIGSTCAIGNKDTITYGGRVPKKGILIPNGKLQECELINGNIVLIPRHVFNIVGYNDPYFHHAIGDNDYGYRVIEAGLKNFVAPSVLGECDEHEQPGTWCDPAVPLSVRWKAMRKPNGIEPEQFFVYERRHHGLPTAAFHYLTTHLHALLPRLWNLKK